MEPLFQQRSINRSEIVLHRDIIVHGSGGREDRISAMEAAKHPAAEHKKRSGGAVISAEAGVRLNAAAKLGKRHTNHAAIDTQETQVIEERHNGDRELAEKIGMSA